jgi:hypothetical protein
MSRYLLILLLGLTTVPAADMADENKVLSVVKDLGGDTWKGREAANKKLLKMAEKGQANIYFIELVSQRQVNDPKTGEPYDLETRRRCKWIVNDVLWATSDIEELPFPGIWHLRNDMRFPCGVVYAHEPKWEYFKRFADNLDKWWAPVDISAYYYQRARKKYNAEQKSVNKWFEPISDKVWRNYDIEKLATKMMMQDLLRGGMPKREVERLLNRMAYWKTSLVIQQLAGYNQETNGWVYPKPPPHE